jgi:hypothetical protein
MEIIKESLLNSNDNNAEEKLEKKPEINIKRIEHKKVKKSTTKQIDKNKNNYDEAKNSNISKDFEEKTINNEDNDNYFYINEEKKQIGSKKINNKIITFEKEPRDTVRNNEPKDNYRNKNKNIALMNKEFKHKFNSANISSSSPSKKNIFEDLNLNPSNKLVNTNKKDVVFTTHKNNNLINININTFNHIKKIELKDITNNNQFYDKQIMNSPSSIKFNNKLLLAKDNKDVNGVQLNNCRKINKINFNNIKNNNNTINEKKSKTLKNELQFFV